MHHIHTLSLRTKETNSEPKVWDEFVVDGRDLSKSLDIEGSVSALGWGCKDYLRVQLDWFMLKTVCEELEGRLPLYVCNMCGDFSCGVGTVQVRREDSVIIWEDFRWKSADDDWVKQSSGEKFFKRAFREQQYMELFENYSKELR